MRKILALVGFVFASTALAFSQPPSHPGKGPGFGDDQDNGAPQIGWALVTPAAIPTVGPVVFETFGARSDAGDSSTIQAGVLPPDLTREAILFVDSNGRLSKNVGIAIVNPNDVEVTVTMTLRKSDGTTVATTTPPLAIPSHHQISKFVTELFENEPSVLSDLTGTLDVTSTGPISLIGVRFRGSNSSTIPVTNLSTPAPVPPFILNGDNLGGTGAVLLPQFVTGGGWSSEVVIINPGASSLTVRVDLFKPNGQPLTANLNGESGSSFKSLTIPAGGALVLAPRNSQSDDDFYMMVRRTIVTPHHYPSIDVIQRDYLPEPTRIFFGSKP